ncbi:MAG: hypothetical protein JSV66_15935 [Trueperaceae bacterium]|nr:MAG: hypothetical protein JSV66_15935 [Trueperaceae bacterium]
MGTVRMALQAGIRPRRHALGAAAALAAIEPALLTDEVDLEPLLTPLWPEETKGTVERSEITTLIRDGAQQLRRWRRSGCPDLETFWLLRLEEPH